MKKSLLIIAIAFSIISCDKINKLKYQKTKLIDTVDNLNEKIFILKNKNQKLKNKNFEKELE